MKYFVLLIPLFFLTSILCAEESFEERVKNATPEAREMMLIWDKEGEGPKDLRHAPPRTLHDGSNFTAPKSKEEWQGRAKYLREQVLVAAGLWPLPDKSERCPLETVIHGKVERGTYSVEKVYFQSYPGFYVSGLLYRPLGKTGPFPGVLCPHGHHKDGRFTEKSPKEVEAQIKGGWEKDPIAAADIQQARCANLAMLGCIVFQYDMVGYADSDPVHFPHRKTYWGLEYEMNGLGVFGLQLWDSMRSLDFLESLPDVDKSRLACTGESGGATQTFTLMATDDRLACAAPVCMISAGEHQGGCNCENTALLRLFTDNVELAATFAPKPFIHPSATGDWTKDFMEKGFPEIKDVYKLFGAQDNVEAMRQKADHNYNLASREAVYNFFNKHLRLGNPTPIVEAKFDAILPPSSMSVFDAQHPRPANAVDADQLKKFLAESTAKRIEALMPKDIDSLNKYREVLGPALVHMVGAYEPAPKVQNRSPVRRPNMTIMKMFVSSPFTGAKIPYLNFARNVLPANPMNPSEASEFRTLLVLPGGKISVIKTDGSVNEIVNTLLAKKHNVATIDVFGVGENTNPNDQKPLDFIKDFVAGYNRTLLANRVMDIVLAIQMSSYKKLNLICIGDQGPACLLAAALSQGRLERVAIDANHFDFDQVKEYSDINFLPSAARFGGIWPFSGLIAPTELFIFNTGKPEVSPWLKAAYKSAGAEDKLKFSADKPEIIEILQWIAR